MNWLSVAEIAKLTDIPAPTARRYAALFRDYLPSRKIGRVTKYAENAVEIFKTVSSLYQEGHVTGEIEDALKQDYSRTAEVAPEPASLPSPGPGSEFVQSFKEVMDKFSACLQIIADQKIMIERQREDIQKLKTAFVLLSRSQKRLRHLPAAPSVPALDTAAFDERTAQLAKKDSELEEMTLNLSFDTSDIKAKMQILESELVRLRKDRREMEKFFQSKIDRMREEED